MEKLLRRNQLKIVIIMFLMFFSSTSNSKIRNGLSGAYFRVSAHHFPPYQLLIQEANGTFRYVGSTPNIIYWMAEKFNFTYDLIPVSKSEHAKFGYVQAGLNQIINKEVDISTLCIVPTLERAQYMEFSYPVAIESYKYMVPNPEEESRLLAPIRPFQYAVWGCVLLSLLSVLVIFSYFSWCYSRWNSFPTGVMETKKKIVINFGNYAMYIASICTNQGMGINIRQSSFRIMAGAWLLAATVLVNCYSGTLTSSLTLTKYKPTVNSMEDLAASRDLTMTASANTVMTNTILNSNSTTLKAIGDAMRKKPESIFLNSEKGMHNIFSLKYVFPTIESYMSYLINIDFKANNKCRFHLTSRIPITEPYTFGLEKGNKLNQLFSEKIQYLWETGLMMHWLKNNLPPVDKCLAKSKDSARQKPIKLVDLTSAFFILGIGVSIALFSFLMEVIYFRFLTVMKGQKPIV